MAKANTKLCGSSSSSYDKAVVPSGEFKGFDFHTCVSVMGAHNLAIGTIASVASTIYMMN